MLGNLLGTGKDKPEQCLISVKLCVLLVFSLISWKKEVVKVPFEVFLNLSFHLRNLKIKTLTPTKVLNNLQPYVRVRYSLHPARMTWPSLRGLSASNILPPAQWLMSTRLAITFFTTASSQITGPHSGHLWNLDTIFALLLAGIYFDFYVSAFLGGRADLVTVHKRASWLWQLKADT